MAVLHESRYQLIRNKLKACNPKIIKQGIQDMLHMLEAGYRFSGGAKDTKADFKAFVLSLLQNEDSDIRKWLYHMLCFSPLDKEKEEISNSCLMNIPFELSDQNIENISWIVSVCAVNSKTLDAFNEKMNQHQVLDLLTDKEVQLAESAFRVIPFKEINQKILNAALDDFKSLAPIWITKTYANQFLPTMRKYHYSKTHGSIPIDAFVTLLSHPDEEVRKYTMWAFAQEPRGNMHSILPFVPLSKALTLEAGIQKWYFAKMFQDEPFVRENSDFIQEISMKLSQFPQNVREGILLGCNKLGYSEELSEFILDWEQESWETTETIRLSLYEYIFTYAKVNPDFFEVSKAISRNVEDIEYPSVKSLLKSYNPNYVTGGIATMSNPQIVFNAQNVQYNTGGNNTQWNHSSLNQTNADKSETDRILEEIKRLKEQLTDEHEYADEKYDSMIAHINYSLKETNEKSSNEISKQLQMISDRVSELRTVKPNKRNEKLKELLSTTSNALTLATATPVLVEFVLELVQNVKSLF